MLKKQRTLTIILLTIPFIIGLLTTCSKNPKCWGDNKNKGIIESSINIYCEPIAEQKEFTITEDSTYKQSFAATCSLPTIDFNSFSLLGLYAEGQCEIKFIREVTRSDNENKYHYKVKIRDCGQCESLGYSYNWVTVPKLQSGWTVTFETDTK